MAKPKEKVDLRPVLQPLSAAEIQSELPGGTACDFSSGGQLLLVAGASDSVAKVNGRIVHFTAQGPAPVDSSGGFFTGGNFTISVGRTVDDPIAGGQGTSWEGRIALTDRARDGAHRELEGIWRCAAPTAVIVRTQP
ncbi:hypothetical protein [Allosphingosinicella sp.]|uniref:hypothetical protein n=1 Tax=Allosphingosinicella sp. TaxID=2823234 RepID=UPI002F02C336